jgi:hypothetical protein
MELPAYGPRSPAPSPLAPFEAFLREPVGRFPDLTGRRLCREIRKSGFTGGYSTVTDLRRHADLLLEGTATRQVQPP